MNTRFDITTVAAALAARTSEVATGLLGEPNRRLSRKCELRFGRKGSLAVLTHGTKAGCWYDHENGEGGDLINLIEHVQGVSFREAVNYAEGIIGSVPARPSLARIACAPSADDESTRHRHRVGELWREAVPIADTVAQRYLARRGIVGLPVGVDGAVLRFHPACPFGGARTLCMLAIMRDVHTNEPRAIYRTALTPTAEKSGRMAMDPKTGAAVKLSADEAVTQGLAIGEDVETVLSGMQLEFCPAWALGDAAAVENFPVVSGIEALSIFVDNDASGRGQSAALECSARWTEAGREVFRVIPDRCGDDMNEVVQRRHP